MSRLIFTLFSILIILGPVSLHAGDKTTQKKQVISLFKNYKTSLGEGKDYEALAFAEQMYALTPKAFGKISKTHSTATYNLAYINDRLGDNKFAAKYYQEHIDILDELNVPKDEKYLAKLGALSTSYKNSYQTDQAIKYGKMGLRLAKSLKSSDEILAGYELILGIYYSGSYNKGIKARGHINKAYDLFLKSYGKHHYKTATARSWQAKMDMAYGKNRRAAGKLEEVLGVYNEELSAGHDKILQVHAFLVNIYEKIGETDKATEHCIAVATERPLDFDREIKPLYKIAPHYPRSAQASGKSGYIIAEFSVDEFGQTADFKIIETTHEVFNKAAIKALSKFRYAPSIKNGERVKTEGVLHKITFQMSPKKY